MPRRPTVKVVEEEQVTHRTMDKMTVLIDSQDLKEMYSIVGMDPDYKNISEIIRAAVRAFIRSYYDNSSDKMLHVELPSRLQKRLSLLVSSKEFKSSEDAVEYAIRELTREYRDEIAEAKSALSKRVDVEDP